SAIEEVNALGVLETYDAAAIIVAADQAAKTADVELIELRLARGMCGKSFMLLTGDVAAVQAAIERARNIVGENGMYLDSSVIPHPDKKIRDSIL
ncbi:MAG: BMC domain-containing protein, partial [Lachnospiraceae bacterium]